MFPRQVFQSCSVTLLSGCYLTGDNRASSASQQPAFSNAAAQDRGDGSASGTSRSGYTTPESVTELNRKLRFLSVEVESRERSVPEDARSKHGANVKSCASASAFHNTTIAALSQCYFLHSKKHITPSCDCSRERLKNKDLIIGL